MQRLAYIIMMVADDLVRNRCQVISSHQADFTMTTMSINHVQHTCLVLTINSLKPIDAIWWHRTRSTLVQVLACCLTAPSHYLNQCWLIISRVHWHMRAIWHKTPQPSITNITLKIIYQNFNSNLPGFNELNNPCLGEVGNLLISMLLLGLFSQGNNALCCNRPQQSLKCVHYFEDVLYNSIIFEFNQSKSTFLDV